MTTPGDRRRVAYVRVYRAGDAVPPEEAWPGPSPEARMQAVWELTLATLGWDRQSSGEPRLQRNITRILRKPERVRDKTDVEQVEPVQEEQAE